MRPLDDWTETEDFYRRLLQGIRNFTTWQPVFAKLDDAARFARTLADYEASAQEGGRPLARLEGTVPGLWRGTDRTFTSAPADHERRRGI